QRHWRTVQASPSARRRSGETGLNGGRMKGRSVALLVSMISLAGCARPVELLFKNSTIVDHLDGNYQRLASCTYEHLARQQAQLSMTDLRKQQTVRITFSKAPQTYWERRVPAVERRAPALCPLPISWRPLRVPASCGRVGSGE